MVAPKLFAPLGLMLGLGLPRQGPGTGEARRAETVQRDGHSRACLGQSLREGRMAVVLPTEHQETSYHRPSDLLVCVLLAFGDLMEK